jgi:hypothetical protein
MAGEIKFAGKPRRKMNGYGAILQHFLDGKTVKEAAADLIVVPQKEDIQGATKHDPQNCAFARACARAYGSSKVLFLGTVAYVELPDSKGKKIVERFVLPAAARQYIVDFDAGRRVSPGGFRLVAPSANSTLSARLKAARRRERSAALNGGEHKLLKKGSSAARPRIKPVGSISRISKLRASQG